MVTRNPPKDYGVKPAKAKAVPSHRSKEGFLKFVENVAFTDFQEQVHCRCCGGLCRVRKQLVPTWVRNGAIAPC